MIKITRLEHLDQVPKKEIVPYIKKLLEHILKEYEEYCPNGSLETIGAIYFVDSKGDWDKYLDFGLSMPVDESRFEWIETIEHGFVDSCIVLDNDRAINLIGPKENFKHLMED